MASLIQTDSKPSTSAVGESHGLNKVSSHPMFQDLQATLATECFQSFVPYTLCSDQDVGSNPPEDMELDPSYVAVQEAHLQSQFQTLSPENQKVQELQNFYSTQCAEIETQRCEAIAKLKGQVFQDETQYQTELFGVHKFHDRQRMHLTNRVSSSLDLLKVALPSNGSVANTGTSKPRSRQLNAKAVEIMSQWFERNINNPYPSEAEKEKMADAGNISLGQVKAWFANKRNRTSNTKPKRQKQQVEKKLLTICSELTSDDGSTPRLYGDIIQKLSNIINRSTMFSQGLSVVSQPMASAGLPAEYYSTADYGTVDYSTAVFSGGIQVSDNTISSSDDNSNGSV